MTDPEQWRRFMRTVSTVASAALTEPEEGRVATTGMRPADASERFLALAADVGAPPQGELRLTNAQKSLVLTLRTEQGGVAIEIATRGYQALRQWAGARAVLRLGADVSTMLRFDGRGRAQAFAAGCDPSEIRKAEISLAKV